MEIIDTLERILDHGGNITVPQKRELKNYFDISAGLYKSGDKYYVLDPYSYPSMTFDTLEEALKEFTNCLKNVGAIQMYIQGKHPEIDPDMGCDEIRRLVKEYQEKDGAKK